MKKLLFSAALIAVSFTSTAQVGVGTTDPKTTLQVDGKPGDATSVDGIMAPRLTRSQLMAKAAVYDAIPDVDKESTIVYITALSGATPTGDFVNITGQGYYYLNSFGVWQKFTSGGSGKFVDGTNLSDAVYTAGNVGIGTTDPSATLDIVSTGTDNTTNALEIGNATKQFITVDDSGFFIVGSTDDTDDSGGFYTRNGRAGMGSAVGSNANFDMLTFGNNPWSTALNGFRARGAYLNADREAVLSGDKLFDINAAGHNGTTWAWNGAGVSFVAEEDFTLAAAGTLINFITTLPGTNTQTTKMTIRADGNVGIGTTDPIAKLHVLSSSGDAARFESATSNQVVILGKGIARISLQEDDVNDAGYAGKTGFIQLHQDDADMAFYAPGNQDPDIRLSTNNTQILTPQVQLSEYGAGAKLGAIVPGDNQEAVAITSLFVDENGVLKELRNMDIYRLSFLGLVNTWLNTGDYARLAAEVGVGGNADFFYGYINNNATTIYRIKFNAPSNSQIRSTTIETLNPATRAWSAAVAGDPIEDAGVYFHRIIPIDEGLAKFVNGTTNTNDAVFASGNVGIGNTSPNATSKLEVTSNNTVNHAAISALGNVATKINIVPNISNSGFNPITTSGDGGIIFAFDTDGAVDASNGLVIAPHSGINGPSGIKIMEAGNVGIGVADPQAELHVRGSVIIGNTTAATAPVAGGACVNAGEIAFTSPNFFGCSNPGTGLVWSQLNN
jgi:hypothetical protein